MKGLFIGEFVIIIPQSKNKRIFKVSKRWLTRFRNRYYTDPICHSCGEDLTEIGKEVFSGKIKGCIAKHYCVSCAKKVKII